MKTSKVYVNFLIAERNQIIDLIVLIGKELNINETKKGVIWYVRIFISCGMAICFKYILLYICKKFIKRFCQV